MPNDWDVDELPQRGQLLVKPGTTYRFGTPQPNGTLVREFESPQHRFGHFLCRHLKVVKVYLSSSDRGKLNRFLVAASALAKNPNEDFERSVISVLACASQVYMESFTMPFK